MRIAYFNKLGVFTLALIYTSFAAIAEIAMVGQIDGVGHLSGNGIQRLVAIGSDKRLALLQSDCVRMHRVVEYFLNGTFFDNSAGIHNDNLVCHFGNNAEVVRNKHNRAALALL